MEILPDFVANL